MSEISFHLPLVVVFILLLVVGMTAGFIDTLAGGGGMITIPSLLIAGLPPDAALATNKLQGSFGTVSASWYFIRRGHLQFCCLLPNIMACAIGAAIGTGAVQLLPTHWLALFIPILLIMVAGVFILMPALGEVETEARMAVKPFILGCLAPIGFYDGFLGPGTGSFFLLALIALQGYTLQNATIEAKLYNATTNVISLIVFLIGGKIVWLAGFSMAVGQLIGARIASGIVVSKGNKLIRPMVITVSIIMSVYLITRNWFYLF
ncbi:TSUP family transporter [Suttonella ornithocola]|uniref:Probable membrane transporter protein n=1 Tax=Suttonella ornithocola TaxID=279832 RepID=A0A380MVN9_9GAMM|nr:TSUP family transporter [Suttonella ornithocola]SUO95467.1 Sulfite exporter TauE/SafE [Suttonella ornithocola]